MYKFMILNISINNACYCIKKASMYSGLSGSGKSFTSHQVEQCLLTHHFGVSINSELYKHVFASFSVLQSLCSAATLYNGTTSLAVRIYN